MRGFNGMSEYCGFLAYLENSKLKLSRLSATHGHSQVSFGLAMRVRARPPTERSGS